MLRRAFIASTVALGASTRRLQAQTPGLTTIRVISSPSDDLRPMLYAQGTGLFEKAGLNVTLERASSGAIVAQSVIAGAMDVGKSSLSPLIAAHARGIPFLLVAPSAVHRKELPNSGLLVTTASPAHTALDLQNKIVSCTAIGDIGYLGLRAMIDAQGGDSSTVHFVELPTSSTAAAVEAGRIDAGLTTEPYMTKDLSTGKVRILLDILAGYPRPILESAFFATRDYVDKNRDVVARFARTLQQAAAYSNAHEAETLPLFVTYSGMDAQVAAAMHKTITATSFDPLQIQPIIDLAAKYKIIPQRFDARDMISTAR